MAKTLYERDMEDSLRQIAVALGVAWENFPDVEDLIRKAHKAGKDAERYRWLRSLMAVEDVRRLIDEFAQWDWCETDEAESAKTDAAVDAAMVACKVSGAA